MLFDLFCNQSAVDELKFTNFALLKILVTKIIVLLPGICIKLELPAGGGRGSECVCVCVCVK